MGQCLVKSGRNFFYTFAGILTEKNPSLATGLMKYGFTINELAFRGRDWRFYDEQFRRAHHGQDVIPWGQINVELYLHADKAKQANSAACQSFSTRFN